MTHDITNNIDTITNYQVVINKIIKKSIKSKITISSIIKRYDRKNIDKKVTALNENYKKFAKRIKSI